MNPNIIPLAILTPLILLLTLGMMIINLDKEAEATGCPIDTIVPFIDDAIKSLEAGDTNTALSQMQDARNELSDTFGVEE